MITDQLVREMRDALAAAIGTGSLNHTTDQKARQQIEKAIESANRALTDPAGA